VDESDFRPSPKEREKEKSKIPRPSDLEMSGTGVLPTSSDKREDAKSRGASRGESRDMLSPLPPGRTQDVESGIGITQSLLPQDLKIDSNLDDELPPWKMKWTLTSVSAILFLIQSFIDITQGGLDVEWDAFSVSDFFSLLSCFVAVIGSILWFLDETGLVRIRNDNDSPLEMHLDGKGRRASASFTGRPSSFSISVMGSRSSFSSYPFAAPPARVTPPSSSAETNNPV